MFWQRMWRARKKKKKKKKKKKNRCCIKPRLKLKGGEITLGLERSNLKLTCSLTEKLGCGAKDLV